MSLLAKAGFRPEPARELEALLREGGPHVSAAPIPVGETTEPRPTLIVHLSDPHFGGYERDGKHVDMHRFFDSENSTSLSDSLTAEISRAAQTRGARLEEIVLVVSGDLTYTAKESEFRRVQVWLSELIERLGISSSQIVVVPGNHDVDWKLAEIEKSRRFDNYSGFLCNLYGRDQFHALYPLAKWDFQITTARPKASEVLYFRRHGPTVIVGLNSCVYETHQEHYGFIGLNQLHNVKGLLEGVDEAVVKIAVMHHHLHPFPEPLDIREGSNALVDISTVRDAGLVEQSLERLGFDLVLHGHKHKPQLRETYVRDRYEEGRFNGSPLIVSGAGSVGVNSRELEQNEANHYSLIEVLTPERRRGADFLRIEWREFSYAPGADWATTQRWTLRG